MVGGLDGEQHGEKRFRATQLFRWIHQKGQSDFAQMSDLAKSQVTEAAEKAIKANPSLQEGWDFVYNDLKEKLTKTGQLDKAIDNLADDE